MEFVALKTGVLLVSKTKTKISLNHIYFVDIGFNLAIPTKRNNYNTLTYFVFIMIVNSITVIFGIIYRWDSKPMRSFNLYTGKNSKYWTNT